MTRTSAKLATLGSINIELLIGPKELQIKSSEDYGELNVVNGVTQLQHTGRKADKIELPIVLHPRLGIAKPEDRISAINKARKNGTVLSFTFASGEYIGDFVITDVTQLRKDTDNKGRPVYVEMTLSLQEYVSSSSSSTTTGQAVSGKSGLSAVSKKKKSSSSQSSQSSQSNQSSQQTGSSSSSASQSTQDNSGFCAQDNSGLCTVSSIYGVDAGSY